MATSKRVGNYSTSADAVIRNSDAIFDAAMSNKPDFTKISKEAIKGRSLERRAVTEAEGEVANAGLKAFRDANLTKIEEDTKKEVADILRPAKRMAGVVAGLGAISGAALMHKNLKEDRAEREAYKAEVQAINDKQTAMFEQTQQMQTEMLETLKAGLTNTPATVTTPKPSGAGSTNTTSKPISSGDALDAGSGNAGSGKLYTQQQITQFAKQAGFSPENARIMGAIAMGESRGNSGIDTVQSGLDPGKKNEYSIGLTQINVQAHGDKLSRRGWTAEDLRDPVKNLTIAKEVYDEVGSFKPWSVYTSGKYNQYLK